MDTVTKALNKLFWSKQCTLAKSVNEYTNIANALAMH